jgi:hypothetical protein
MDFWCWVISPIIGAIIYLILHESHTVKRWLTCTKRKVDKKLEDLK